MDDPLLDLALRISDGDAVEFDPDRVEVERDRRAVTRLQQVGARPLVTAKEAQR